MKIIETDRLKELRSHSFLLKQMSEAEQISMIDELLALRTERDVLKHQVNELQVSLKYMRDEKDRLLRGLESYQTPIDIDRRRKWTDQRMGRTDR